MGNYSKNPQTALQQALDKGYTRVRFQQGKPILDRELNLLGDLSGTQTLARHHIGNGVPYGSDGFRVTGFNFAASDFVIKGGRCLVNGLEVVLASDTTYKTQPNQSHVAPLPITNASGAFVYLRVSTSEVTDAQDTDLGNSGDIGFETALREKVDWEVVVSVPAINQPDHFLLADFVNMQGNQTSNDRRLTGVTLARIREELNTTSGSAAGISARLDNIMTGNALKDNLITQSKMADNAIGNAEILDNAVNENKLANNAVTENKIANNAVTQNKLADNSVTQSKLADNSVGTGEILNGSVTVDKLASDSVTNDKLANPCVSTDNISDGTITDPKMAFFIATSGSVTLGINETRDIAVQNNVGLDKMGLYFTRIALGSTFGQGTAVVRADIIYKQDVNEGTHRVVLRLNNSPAGAFIFIHTVEVFYRVDILSP
ncbi:MAG TPA: hypothetical protein VGV59_19405 [Pyrinomonadaceae bacterium]|nr:hypothetical protein [Pyrinomonadaceae bacterium]